MEQQQSLDDLELAGELFAQLREHMDEAVPNWCPRDQKFDCSAYGYAKTELTRLGHLDGR